MDTLVYITYMQICILYIYVVCKDDLYRLKERFFKNLRIFYKFDNCS